MSRPRPEQLMVAADRAARGGGLKAVVVAMTAADRECLVELVDHWGGEAVGAAVTMTGARLARLAQARLVERTGARGPLGGLVYRVTDLGRQVRARLGGGAA